MLAPAAFFHHPAQEAAPALLGNLLTHTLPDGTVLSALVTETEAFLAESDAASHYYRKLSLAWQAFAQGPGTLYIHPMRQYVGMDLVAEKGSVLLRGGLAVTGINPSLNLNGPARLTRALRITRQHFGLNATNLQSPVQIHLHPNPPEAKVAITPRIGISKNTEAMLRFVLTNPQDFLAALGS